MPGIFVEPDDACLYVTEACNSNCIMCPMSRDSRKRGTSMPEDQWEKISEMIPNDTRHITITGGEPFLESEKLFRAMETINETFPYSEVLVLTNGRAFALPSIRQKVEPLITAQYCFAVPLHAPDSSLHDQITQSPGSFDQTMAALRFLSTTQAQIEVRIVAHKLNLNKLSDTFKMLASTCARITVINLIGMEMTGCAAANRNELWVDYQTVCSKAENGIRYAVLHGIDVGLYNFPLCTVPPQFWPLVKSSISPHKVRYDESCKACKEHNACGGMFYSTHALGLCKVNPFVKE